MITEQETFLRKRGYTILHVPYGFVVGAPRREGAIEFYIEREEMDAILSFGTINRLEVLSTEIRIEIHKKQ
jgi:hypothetical protein